MFFERCAEDDKFDMFVAEEIWFTAAHHMGGCSMCIGIACCSMFSDTNRAVAPNGHQYQLAPSTWALLLRLVWYVDTALFHFASLRVQVLFFLNWVWFLLKRNGCHIYICPLDHEAQPVEWKTDVWHLFRSYMRFLCGGLSFFLLWCKKEKKTKN